MDFLIEQAYAADPDEVARAYTEPDLYDLIGAESSLGRPEVLDRTVEDGGKVRLRCATASAASSTPRPAPCSIRRS